MFSELVPSTEADDPAPPTPVKTEDQPYEGGPLQWKGYMYHPRTKKYYKMTSDPSLPQGFSKADLDRMEKAREAKFQANRPRFTSGSFVKRPVFKPITSLLDGKIFPIFKLYPSIFFQISRLVAVQ